MSVVRGQGARRCMSLVWAVIKGDLATSALWFLVYAGAALGQAWWQRRRAAAVHPSGPAWARGVKSPEERFRIALMRRRRRISARARAARIAPANPSSPAG